MKILHTSDWHFGRTFRGADLTPAFEQWADFLVETVRAERIDAVLISGDVYDRGIPPVTMVNLLSDTLARLSSLTRVVMTSGNHDSPQRLGFADTLMKPEVIIRTISSSIGIPVCLPNKNGDAGAIVYPLPYLDPDVERRLLAPDKAEPLARSHEAVIGAAMDRVTYDICHGEWSAATAGIECERIPRIVMAHAFVIGGEASDSEQDIRVGNVDCVPSSIFDRRSPDSQQLIHYVALGHLHGPQEVQRIGEPIMRYSGSPIAFSFSEEHHRKSCALLEFSENSSSPHITLVEAPVYRHASSIRGSLVELTSGKFDKHSEDFVRAYVTDKSRPQHLFAQLRQHFPHILEVIHETSSADIAADNIDTLRTDPHELLTDFFAANGGCEISEEERSLLLEIWEEVQRSEVNS